MQIVGDINARTGATFQKVCAELKKETDRGSVVMAFAWIDEELTNVLKSYCLPPAGGGSASDELFGARGPVSAAGAKIDLAYRLGQIRLDVHRSLHLFRKLRNDFAHLSSTLTFDTPAVRDRVLSIFAANSNVLEAVRSHVIAAKEEFDLPEVQNGIPGLVATLGARRLFDTMAATVVCGLMLAGNQVIPVKPLQ